MLLGTLGLRLRILEPMALPQFKGPTIRGALGYALKPLCCKTPQKKCRNCSEKMHCLYCLLYDTEVSLSRSAPPPFVLVAPTDSKQFFTRFDSLDFEITVIGPAVEQLPLVLSALTRIADRGLGKNFGKTIVESIDSRSPWEVRLIYDHRLGFTGVEPEVYNLVDIVPPAIPQAEQVSIELISPLQIIDHETRSMLEATKITFRFFISSLLGRISTLYHLYDSEAPDWPYDSILSAAEDINTLNPLNPLKINAPRYSTRQRQSEHLPGITGILRFQGRDIAQFAPLIQYGELVHIGSRSAFGFGHYRSMWK